MAKTAATLAERYRFQSRYDKAKPLFERALGL
jgi:hypothetical protein